MDSLIKKIRNFHICTQIYVFIIRKPLLTAFQICFITLNVCFKNYKREKNMLKCIWDAFGEIY